MRDPIYFPLDGVPWPSPESNVIRDKVYEEFGRLCDSGDHSYIRLVASSHWATQGYWIEFKKDALSPVDLVVKEWWPGKADTGKKPHF